MSKVIVDKIIVDDDWALASPTETASGLNITSLTKVIVPLKIWQTRPAYLEGKTVGVWLEGADDPASLEGDIQTLPLIAVNFSTFKDGRGYSIAYLLRTRYGYTGELRAIGDIQRDQLFYLHRVGFNAFAVREDKDIEAALKSLNDFSNAYQASVVQSTPLFRRREAALGAARTA